MNEVPLTVRLSFRVHFIRVHGPNVDPTVRMLLVETSKAQTIYEKFGFWLECKGWVVQLSGYVVSRDQLASVQKCLDLGRLATIKEILASMDDLDSMGFRRVDS